MTASYRPVSSSATVPAAIESPVRTDEAQADSDQVARLASTPGQNPVFLDAELRTNRSFRRGRPFRGNLTVATTDAVTVVDSIFAAEDDDWRWRLT